MINQKVFITDVRELQSKFPKLSYKIDAKTGSASILGEIDIFDSVGTYWESFDILIRVGKNYPYEIPQVFERSTRIERNEKRHISKDGQCCIDLDHKFLIQVQGGIRLTEFLTKKVYPYFANQLFYNEKGYYANGEWDHNFNGVREFYKKDLDISDNKLAIKLIELILSNKIPNRNEPCICGRGKFKNCHLRALEQLKLVGNKRLNEDLIEFKKLIVS